MGGLLIARGLQWRLQLCGAGAAWAHLASCAAASSWVATGSCSLQLRSSAWSACAAHYGRAMMVQAQVHCGMHAWWCAGGFLGCDL